MANRSKDKDKASNFSPAEIDTPFSEPVTLPIEDSLDLHAFNPKDIPSLVGEYIEQCRAAGIYEIRLIHGRGKGIQRRIIQTLLSKHPSVQSFRDAPAQSGGWGATWVVLRHPA